MGMRTFFLAKIISLLAVAWTRCCHFLSRHGLLVTVALALLVWSVQAIRAHKFAGPYQRVDLYRPSTPTGAVVILFADPNQNVDSLIASILERGAIVAAIVPDRYLAHLNDPCQDNETLPEDVGQLTKRILKRADISTFIPPIIIGLGSQARLVEEIVAASTSGGLSGAIIQAQSKQQPSPFSHCPSPNKNRYGVNIHQASNDRGEASILLQLTPLLLSDAMRSTHLPLVEYPVQGAKRAVILLSGDGGWREIDHGMALAFQQHGIAVIGWNSLQYFWTVKSPQHLSHDVAQVIHTYQRRWQIDHFALVGYSFGADVAPFAYNGLSKAQQRMIEFIALLGLEAKADFKISIGGWLGWRNRSTLPVMDAARQIDARKMECVSGDEEKKSLCQSLHALGVHHVVRAGGHHFDHNTAVLAQDIIAEWNRTLNGLTNPLPDPSLLNLPLQGDAPLR